MAYQKEERVIVSLKEMNTTRESLMAAYRLFEVERNNVHTAPNRRKELDAYMESVKGALISLQDYEREIISLSEVSPRVDAQTGYGRDDNITRAIAHAANEREIRTSFPYLL